MKTNPSFENRASPRASLLVFCKVRAIGGHWAQTVLRDLSCTGFRMSWNPSYRIGSKLTLKFPGLENMIAEVRWRNDQEIGCCFKRPLSSYVFDHIVASHSAEADQRYVPQRARIRSYT
jgi:hypothetical protein